MPQIAPMGRFEECEAAPTAPNLFRDWGVGQGLEALNAQKNARTALPANFCTRSLIVPNIDLVGVNEKGRRVGEDNPNATLTDHEVELLLELRETEGWGYRRLARHFDISKSQVRRIVKGQHRSQQAARFKPRCPRQ